MARHVTWHITNGPSNRSYRVLDRVMYLQTRIFYDIPSFLSLPHLGCWISWRLQEYPFHTTAPFLFSFLSFARPTGNTYKVYQIQSVVLYKYTISLHLRYPLDRHFSDHFDHFDHFSDYQVVPGYLSTYYVVNLICVADGSPTSISRANLPQHVLHATPPGERRGHGAVRGALTDQC